METVEYRYTLGLRIMPAMNRTGYLRVCLPFLAGEKKLKTGEKMVPRRVLLGGLVTGNSTAVVSSRLPLGFSLFLS